MTKGFIFFLYIFCCLFLLFLLTLLVPRRHHSTLSCQGGRRPTTVPGQMPGPAAGQEPAAPSPFGIKLLGADAHRSLLTPSAGVASMLLRNPHGHL